MSIAGAAEAILYAPTERPLIVNMDSAFGSEPLLEAFFLLLSTKPLHAISSIFHLGKAGTPFQNSIARHLKNETGHLRIYPEVLGFLEKEKAKGRKIYLLRTADYIYADALEAHFSIFDDILVTPLGTDSNRLLNSLFGEDGFDYISKANSAFGQTPFKIRDYLPALRVHQWLKNLLVFVPALAAHNLTAFPEAVVAFLSFSLCASSIYILNDLLDLSSDRQHPRKRNRPFASGKISLRHGVALFPLLLVAATGLGMFLSLDFLAVLGGYYALSITYAVLLKRKPIVDVVALACLYGMRLLAGGVATGVPISPWLMAFATFIFLSLALMKRYTEIIVHLETDKSPAGRGYILRDLPVLQNMSAASGYVAVLVLALYINSPAVSVLYAHPDWLWFICILLIYWISRILLIANRGDMHDDPVIFAATDRVSQITALLIGLTLLASK